MDRATVERRKTNVAHWWVGMAVALALHRPNVSQGSGVAVGDEAASCRQMLATEGSDLADGDLEFLEGEIKRLQRGISSGGTRDPLGQAVDDRSLNIALDVLSRAFPLFDKVARTYHGVIRQQRPWKVDDYLELRSQILEAVAEKKQSVSTPAAHFAMIHALRSLQRLHSLTPFPDSTADIESEKENAQEQHKQQNTPAPGGQTVTSYALLTRSSYFVLNKFTVLTKSWM